MSLDLTKSDVTVTNQTVTYRTPMNGGVGIVKIFLLSTTPRILVSAQRGRDELPASLFLDEILDYIADAKRRVG
jgi:hypothetical protein